MRLVSDHVEVHLFRRRGRGVEFLILRRAAGRRKLPGVWQPVTGARRRGERALAAAMREVREETGLVPYVQVPTTLLAQVDSSVGGKTAINHPAGKNMIGAFYQPAQVICDLDLLATLPARELSAGLAEVIKYGPIADSGFLEWIEAHLESLRALDPGALAHAVARCCEIKAEVVGADERESGLRAILNFGHTFGHAIEAGLGYGEWLHGEAVGCGMVLADELSARLGLVDASFVERLVRLVRRAGLPVVARRWRSSAGCS